MYLTLLSSASTVIDEAVSTGGSMAMESSSMVWERMIELAITGGEKIIIGASVFAIGRFLVSLIKRLALSMLKRRKIEPGVKSFLMSMLNVLLITLLVVSVVSALGVNTTSFAALIASAGVAVGMALSGNLQNFAGGVVILLFKPYKIGDFIDAQSVSGTVREIQIFHTVITTPDNKQIFIPNGSLSSGVITNVNNQDRRRVQWAVSVEYGEDCDNVEQTLMDILTSDDRILKDPAPFIALRELGDNGIEFTVRGWVETSNYWSVFFQTNKKIYEVFNEKGIGFPYPQLTIHQAEKS